MLPNLPRNWDPCHLQGMQYTLLSDMSCTRVSKGLYVYAVVVRHARNRLIRHLEFCQKWVWNQPDACKTPNTLAGLYKVLEDELRRSQLCRSCQQSTYRSITASASDYLIIPVTSLVLVTLSPFPLPFAERTLSVFISCCIFPSPYFTLHSPAQKWLHWQAMNSTGPDRITHFVSEPAGRGTLGLVWSAFVTIFLCAFTIQRLNITDPPPNELKAFYRKLLWMGITLVAPEFTALVAFDQWRNARKVQDMHDLGMTWWKPVHGFYADMGGICIKLTSTPHFLAKQTGTTFIPEDGTKYTMRTKDIRTLTEKGVLQLPKIPKENILDKSKTDNFAKCVTAFQVLCFTVERFARLALHMPIALLEISTLAYIAISAFVIFFWWDKPLDVRTPLVFHLPPEKEQEFVRIYPELDFTPDEQEVAERLNFKDWYTDLIAYRKYKSKHGLWIGSVFNSIHIAAWNVTFPTPIERLLWRIASILAWGTMFIFAATLLIPKGSVQFFAACIFGLSLEFIARSYLIVEALIELRALPARVYDDVPWKDFLPHVWGWCIAEKSQLALTTSCHEHI